MSQEINKVNQGFKHYFESNGTYSPRKAIHTEDKIRPGIYMIQADNEGNIYLTPKSTKTDNLLVLPDTVGERVYQEALKFWEGNTRSRFEKYGLVYKRGILMHGRPGTGKTCTIARLMERVVAEGGIVFFNAAATYISHAAAQVREIQPDIRIMCVFEDFEGQCIDSNFLALLDGELQMDNVVMVATTNYIERVPERIRNRPSRFATVIEVGAPSKEAREVYFKAKLPEFTQPMIDIWVSVTAGMVIDQMKDMIVSVLCFDQTIEEAYTKIASMGVISAKDSSDDDDDDDEDTDEERGKAIPEGWVVGIDKMFKTVTVSNKKPTESLIHVASLAFKELYEVSLFPSTKDYHKPKPAPIPEASTSKMRDA